MTSPLSYDRLRELAERVELAARGCRDLDADIYEALGFLVQRRSEMYEGRWGKVTRSRAWVFLRDSRWEAMQDFSGSLDAAMRLVSDGAGFHLDRYWIASRKEPAWLCEISTGGVPGNPRQVFAADDAWSAPLAVTSAALRALSGTDTGEKVGG